MSLIIAKNTTSFLLNVFIKDSSVTTGIGKTGLGTANLNVYYYKNGDSQPHQIIMTPSSTGSYISGGWVEIDAARIPGFYQLGLPDEALAEDSSTLADNSVYIIFQDSGFPGVNNAMTTLVEVQLTEHSLDDNLSIQDLPIDVNVTHWNNGAVSAPTVSGIPNVNVTNWDGGVVEEPTVPGMPMVDLRYVNGSIVSGTVSQIDANVVQWSGAEVSATHDGCPEVCATNEVLANVISWDSHEVTASVIDGVPNVNVTNWDGGVVEEPTVAGMPSVNAAYIGGEAASIAAQLDANVVQWSGSEVSATHDGCPEVCAVNEVLANVISWDSHEVTAPVIDGVPNVNVTNWDGGVVEEPTVPGMPSVNAAYAGGEAVSIAAQVDSNVVQWAGAEVSATHDGCPEVCAINEVLANVISWDSHEVTEPVLDGVPNVNVTNWDGGVVEEPTIPGMPSVNAAYIGGESAYLTPQVDANVVQWSGAEVSATHDGCPEVCAVNEVFANVISWDGHEVTAPTVDGVPNVNVTNWVGDAVPIAAIPGAPIVDTTYIAGDAVTLTSLIDANVTHWAGYDATAGSDGLPEVNAVLANVTSVYNDEEAAIDLGTAAATVVRGVARGVPTHLAMPTNLTATVDGYYDDRVVVWTMGALKDVARVINTYSSTGDITYDALPGGLAPAAGDTFVIV